MDKLFNGQLTNLGGHCPAGECTEQETQESMRNAPVSQGQSLLVGIRCHRHTELLKEPNEGLPSLLALFTLRIAGHVRYIPSPVGILHFLQVWSGALIRSVASRVEAQW